MRFILASSKGKAKSAKAKRGTVTADALAGTALSGCAPARRVAERAFAENAGNLSARASAPLGMMSSGRRPYMTQPMCFPLPTS